MPFSTFQSLSNTTSRETNTNGNTQITTYFFAESDHTFKVSFERQNSQVVSYFISSIERWIPRFGP